MNSSATSASCKSSFFSSHKHVKSYTSSVMIVKLWIKATVRYNEGVLKYAHKQYSLSVPPGPLLPPSLLLKTDDIDVWLNKYTYF